MEQLTRNEHRYWPWLSLLVGAIALSGLIFSYMNAAQRVTAHASEAFGPACGMATLDGEVTLDEWGNAASQTFQMYSPGSAEPFTATLYVMNSGHYLYLGITINDDELSPIGNYLPTGDGFRIDFDNDHSGTLFNLHDDVLSVNAGWPQFEDNYIYGGPVASSSDADVLGGGTRDGAGAASRVGDRNHFELRHPLCSGDELDFCLQPTDIVGMRLEYLDAQANGDFGGSQFYPGSEETSEAEIVIGECSLADRYLFLPLISQ